MKGIACVFEDNNIKIDIEPWSSRGKKLLIKNHSIRHLRYNCFKYNI